MDDKFWEKVQRGSESECWPWLGFKKSSGHGLTSYKSVPIHASRKAWILTHGFIPSALCVNHRCDNAACCNPAHMYLGTRRDNMIDFWGKVPPAERKAYGRPFMLTTEQIETLWKLRKDGATLKSCAELMGIHMTTVVRYLTAHRREKVLQLKADRASRNAERM